jgi:hypothetical protein
VPADARSDSPFANRGKYSFWTEDEFSNQLNHDESSGGTVHLPERSWRSGFTLGSREAAEQLLTMQIMPSITARFFRLGIAILATLVLAGCHAYQVYKI